MTHVEILILALALDALFGEPRAIWTRVPHPAVIMGQAIDVLDHRLNFGAARIVKGAIAIAALFLAAMIIGWLIAIFPDFGLLEVAVVAILLAHKCLIDHVIAVREALATGLSEARKSVGMIVGRDTKNLDESGVTRAAIESAAENFSDGVVAPAFWALLFGAPGILIYKVVNTADSMIGHRSAQYEKFGKAAARLDDLLNWIPARISAGLIILAGGARKAWLDVAEDAEYHRSPNAGWPEAAMAYSLDAALAGPRSYFGETTTDPFIHGNGRRELTRADITAAVRLLWRAWRMMVGTLIVLALLWRILP